MSERQKTAAGNPARGAAHTLTFDSNDRLRRLVGPTDMHLKVIEQRLGVEVLANGNQLVVSGEPGSTAHAVRALQKLNEYVDTLGEISLGNVEAAIRVEAKEMTSSENEAPGKAEAEPMIDIKRKKILPRSTKQASYLTAMAQSTIIFAVGPAGTGKTYLAVAQAVAALESGEADRIVLSRPAIEAGEQLGFLPGDLREKVDPYLRPLYDALHDLMGAQRVEKLLERGQIEIAPLAFMRGRTLADAFVILDEAQNCNRLQMKMFLTRLGSGAKMVICGDPSQVDLMRGQQSGLAEASEILGKIDGISTIVFSEEDVVRHALVGKIVQAYQKLSSP